MSTARGSSPLRKLVQFTAFALAVALTYGALRLLAPSAPEVRDVSSFEEHSIATRATLDSGASTAPRIPPGAPPPWNTPTLELQFEQVAQWRDELRARADAGDRQARALLLRAKRPCFAGTQWSDEEIDGIANANFRQSVSPNMSPDKIAEAKRFSDEVRSTLRDQRDLCQSLASIDREHFLEQLTDVLQSIDVDWFDIVFTDSIGGGDPYANVRYAERLIALHKAYRAQLARRIAAGELRAMTMLAFELRKDSVLGPDLPQADAYDYAISLLTPDATPIEPANEQARVLGTEIAQRFRRH